MNRRKFLNSLVGGIAASTAVRTFPFRVFSFPSEIHIPETTLGFAPFHDYTMFPPLFSVGDLINIDNELVVVTGVNFSGRFPSMTVRRGLRHIQEMKLKPFELVEDRQ